MKISITRKIPETALQLLREADFEINISTIDRPLNSDELIKCCKNADGIICLLTDKFDKDMIDKLTKCKVIANYAVGFNNIDIEYAKEKNIIVTNTPDILTEATADTALLLMLSCARRSFEAEKFLRDGKFNGWSPDLFLGMDLSGKILGVIGAGKIGQAVAKRAYSFGMKIIYFSRGQKREIENKFKAKKVSLKKLLSSSDFVSIHLNLSESTKNLLSKENLNLLKKTAVVVNTARGEILDEDYLIKMLKSNKIFAAGFDVYRNEPKINPELKNLNNVVLLPHIGSATFDTRNKMAELAAKNVINVLKGKKALTPVN